MTDIIYLALNQFKDKEILDLYAKSNIHKSNFVLCS